MQVNSDSDDNPQINAAIDLALKYEAHLCGLYVIQRLNLPTYAGAYIPAGVLQAHEEAEGVATQRADFIEKHKSEIKEGLWYTNEVETEMYMAAFSLLVKARKFLKHSYVAAWSQEDDKARIFQDQQAILEVATEKLTQLTMSRLDETFSYKGYPGIQFVFRSMDFHVNVICECMDRLLAMA